MRGPTWWTRKFLDISGSGMFTQVLTIEGFCLVALGTLLGITVGAVPGLTGAMLISLSLPLTFSMEGTSAMLLLVSMYVGAVSGGLISATLLRMPGTPASVMTTLDGYPMARQGRARRALVLGAGASLFGGLVSWGFLVLLAKPVSEWSTRFGPFEFFSLVLMALSIIAGMGGRGAVLRGLFAGSLGILFAMPGLSPATGEPRWIFGFPAMSDGFKLLPVLIGLFAMNQVLREVLGLAGKPEVLGGQSRGMLPSFREWRDQLVNLLRSSVIGTWVGILPGAGANVGSVMAYSASKGLSSEPEKFGTGCDEGVVASESANNATVGGALIPLVAMGIPGSLIDAILLGAFVLHGLQPGPLLFANHPEVVDAILGAALVANLVMFAVMFWMARWIAKLAFAPRAILLPMVVVCSVIGSFALSNRMFDVWVMLAFGVVGFVMERLRIPLAPFVIGFVLAPIAEENLAAGLMASGGSLLPMFTRPISLVFVLIAIGLLVGPVLLNLKKTIPKDNQP